MDEFDENGVLHFKGTPFSGVAWKEFPEGFLEDTLAKGVEHGRCVRFHANGWMAADGYFQDGMECGDHFKWYDSGVIKKFSHLEQMK